MSRYANTGTPMAVVIAPTGNSYPDSNVRASRSAATIRNPPNAMVAGSIRRWSPPRIILLRCGMTSPTNPMTPQNATQMDVSTDAMISITASKRLAFRPICLAWSSPSRTRLNSLAQMSGIMHMKNAGISTSHSLSHVMLAKEPYNHDRALATLVPALIIISDCTAENTRPMTIPART